MASPIATTNRYLAPDRDNLVCMSKCLWLLFVIRANLSIGWHCVTSRSRDNPIRLKESQAEDTLAGVPGQTIPVWIREGSARTRAGWIQHVNRPVVRKIALCSGLVLLLVFVVLGMPLAPSASVDGRFFGSLSQSTHSPSVARVPEGFSDAERLYARLLYRLYVIDATSRLNEPSLTGLSDHAFSAMIVAKILTEDATVYADQQPVGLQRELATIPPAFARRAFREWTEGTLYQGEISWGLANMTLPNALGSMGWWEENCRRLGHDLADVRTAYYSVRAWNPLEKWLLGWNEESSVIWEMQTGQGAVEILALSILHSASRARAYYERHGQPSHQVSAYAIALGIEAYGEEDTTLYRLSDWTSRGYYHDWVETVDDAAALLGLEINPPDDYLPYTDEEREILDRLPPG